MATDTLDAILDIAKDPDQEQTTDTTLAEVVDPASNALVVPEQEQTALTVQSVPVEEKLDKDFEYAREGMKDLIKKGREAVDSAIMLAVSGDNHNAYRVVGEMITAIVQANKELIQIHKTKRETTETGNAPLLPVEGGGTVNIDKAVFVGRASDLLREIRALAKPKGDTDAEKS